LYVSFDCFVFSGPVWYTYLGIVFAGGVY
jgi:hypothetical protein